MRVAGLTEEGVPVDAGLLGVLPIAALDGEGVHHGAAQGRLHHALPTRGRLIQQQRHHVLPWWRPHTNVGSGGRQGKTSELLQEFFFFTPSISSSVITNKQVLQYCLSHHYFLQCQLH